MEKLAGMGIFFPGRAEHPCDGEVVRAKAGFTLTPQEGLLQGSAIRWARGRRSESSVRVIDSKATTASDPKEVSF